MQIYDFKVLLEPDETGGYVVLYPAVPGCCSQGESLAEATQTSRRPSNSAWETSTPAASLFARRK